MHAYRTHTCGALRLADVGQQVAALRLGPSQARPRQPAVHRSARPLRPHPVRARHLEPAVQGGRGDARRERRHRHRQGGEAPGRDGQSASCRPARSSCRSRTSPCSRPPRCCRCRSTATRTAGEEIRLRYRFLDLRREKVHRNIVLRSQVIASIRRRMIEQGFTEFQTPILTSSSPEGARDFLVPSRLHPGKFYALPQAPQQFKQLLMVAGFDRYFQIAPCFRDEDSRADRSPGRVLPARFRDVVRHPGRRVRRRSSRCCTACSRNSPAAARSSPPPFPRIPFDEAMLKYGSDKPDLRNPIVIADVTEVVPRLRLRHLRQGGRGRRASCARSRRRAPRRSRAASSTS